jgi:hypothetical protein
MEQNALVAQQVEHLRARLLELLGKVRVVKRLWRVGNNQIDGAHGKGTAKVLCTLVQMLALHGQELGCDELGDAGRRRRRGWDSSRAYSTIHNPVG